MSIKRSLTFIAVLLAASSFCLAGFMVWNSAKNIQQVENANLAVMKLYAAAEMRAHIIRQFREVLEYSMTDAEENRAQFLEYAEKARVALLAWRQMKNQSAANRGKPGEQQLRNLDTVTASYGRVQKILTRVEELTKGGGGAEAFKVIEDEAEPLVYGELFKSVDAALAEELEEVEGGYNRVLVSMGSVPWMSTRTLDEVRKCQAAVRYLRAIDRVHVSMERQMELFVDFLITGEEPVLRDFEQSAVSTREGIEELVKTIELQKALGQAGEDNDEKTAVEVKEGYERLLVASREAARLKLAGHGQKAHLVFVKRMEELAETELFPEIVKAINDSRAEIEETHQSLHAAAIHAALEGGGALLAILLLILTVVSLLTKNILGSLENLRSEVEHIRAGNLDYRIEMQGKNELAALAASFNGMCDELGKSRQEIVSARDRSEQAAQELQESNDELRNFTYIFFHDLREPLVNLKGFTGELQANLAEATELLRESAERLAERVRERLTIVLQQEAPEALHFIDTSVHQMDLLFNAILTMSRLGRRKLKPETLDMTELVQSAAAAHVQQAAKLTIGPLPSLVADRTSMKLIIGHLLDNAMKYLQPGRPGEIAVSAEPGNEAITFHIRDNGRGIAHEDLSKIFDIFRRAGRQDVAGEGMGLAYVKTLVRRHGGRLWCVSELGVGSTFSFSIPQKLDFAE